MQKHWTVSDKVLLQTFRVFHWSWKNHNYFWTGLACGTFFQDLQGVYVNSDKFKDFQTVLEKWYNEIQGFSRISRARMNPEFGILYYLCENIQKF